ncbi:unnamed protein product [Staurois parvus]|uniref:Uncharacterized protein n=1 Tax=Staurois parvus TaxID=386267 RepID=A0ABN9ELW2_9NEOB|nr:unnamed protein product [Staurois parvus]
MYIHTQTRAHTDTCTYIHTNTHTDTCIHTDTCTDTHMYIHTDTCTCIHRHTQTHTHVHVHTHTHKKLQYFVVHSQTQVLHSRGRQRAQHTLLPLLSLRSAIEQSDSSQCQ